MVAKEQKLFVLFDGHGLAYRMYHAMPMEHFTTHSGEPTNATFGFMRTMLDLINADNPPDYLAVSFDAGLSGREVRYKDYKANRDEAPEGLEPQVERLHQILEAFNIPILEVKGYEADDVIGTVAKRISQRGNVHTLIVTGDRDLLQLVDDNITAQLPKRGGGTVRYDWDGVVEKMGVPPDQVVDFKALVGDSSDNIPGVAGVGKKTATKLLEEYGSVKNIYDNLENISSTRARNALTGEREQAFLSYELAEIMTDVPIEFELEDSKLGGWDRDRILELFQELEFRSLSAQVPGTPPKVASLGQQMPMFEPEAPKNKVTTDTEIILTEAQLAALAATLNKASEIAFDTETTGVSKMDVALVGISFAVEAGTGYYIPVGHQSSDEEQLPIETVIDAISPAMTNPNIMKCAHNIKFDATILKRYGLEVAPLSFDTMLGEWLVHNSNSRGKLGLKPMAWRDLQVDMVEIEALIGFGRNQTTMDFVSIDRAAPYAAADADVTLQLAHIVSRRLDENPYARKLFDALEMPLVPVLVRMEMHGILVDVPLLEGLADEINGNLDELSQVIYDICGYEFNLNSPQQLSDALFGKLNLPTDGIRKTKRRHYSTAASVLETLQTVDTTGIISALSDYRELEKLRSTYIESLPQMVNQQTGRIHTSFNQTRTVTGRLSSSDPNLQNIPIRTEQGRRVRNAFIAPDGHQLIGADYSQVELRILAHVSGDEGLRSAFLEGHDIHSATASAVFDVLQDDVTIEQRSMAKRVNFGLMYGMGPYRLARESGYTLQEAKDFIETYFTQFPSVRGYFDTTKRMAVEKGYVETLFGRRRYFGIFEEGDDREPNQHNIAQAEREAINMPIQGTAADIIKVAMIQLDAALLERGLQSKMLLQVHDELIFEVPDDEVDQMMVLIKAVMENAYSLDVPLNVDIYAATNWGSLK